MKLCVISLMSIILMFQPSCSCGEIDLQGGDADANGEPTETPVESPVDIPFSDDMPYESSSDWRPEPSTGTLVPEGEATFYESDVGEDFSPIWMCNLPIAFSGEVYSILVGEDSSRFAAYRFDPRGAGLTTVWYEEVDVVMVASICWTGEVFVASYPVRGEGNRVLTFTEAGEHTRTETVGPIEDWEPSDLMTGDAKQVMCPTSGPFVLDFTQSYAEGAIDELHLLNTDGSNAATRIDVVLPPPSTSLSRMPCAPFGPVGACFSGFSITEKINMFIFDRAGNVWESPVFPGTARFEMGSAIADLGEAAVVFWVDTADGGDHINMGFSILGLDALFITPPTILDLAIDRNDDAGLAAATSGRDVLVVGTAPDERGVESGYYLYLFDFTGNLLNEPLRLETAHSMTCTVTPFWEGDAYALLWSDEGGLMYQRFLVQ
jgi:hypothetical protein